MPAWRLGYVKCVKPTMMQTHCTSQAEALPSMENKLTGNIPHTGECLIQGKTKVWIAVSLAEGGKCERCWNFSLQVGSFPEHPNLCSRCYNVVSVKQFPAVAMAT